MPDVPERFKDREDLSVGETVEILQREHRGEINPAIESPEYKNYKRNALVEAGLEVDEVDDPITPLEDQSVSEHLARIQTRNQPGSQLNRRNLR